MTEKLENTDGKLDEKPRSPPLNAREELGEFFRTAVIAVILALLIRSFLYEPFNIPFRFDETDFRNRRLSFREQTRVRIQPLFLPVRYYSDFRDASGPPSQNAATSSCSNSRRTRMSITSNAVIGLPGDKIQVRSGRLYINNELVPREPVGMVKDEEFPGGPTVAMVEYLETLPGGVIHRIYEESDDEILDDTEVYEVPDGHYFMMGDNRDNSQDSRVTGLVGFVPLENVVGEADFIFFSTNGYARIFEFWKWPWTMRYERFFKSIEPVRPEGKERCRKRLLIFPRWKRRSATHSRTSHWPQTP
jgi:signal peptidase I